MKTSAVTTADLSASVFAVPPLARGDDLAINWPANLKLIRHIEAGEVGTILYGGNANIYNIGIDQYGELLDLLEDAVAPDTWVIPSAGPDYGKLMEQARLLRARLFPTAMVLPLAFPSMPAGACEGVRRFTDALGRPAILYLKSENWLRLADIAELVEEGRVCGIKYAIPRAEPRHDPFLASLLQQVDRSLVVCGLAEEPALVHMDEFGLASFTSGGVCIAPRLATLLLRCAQSATPSDLVQAARVRELFLPLENLRARANVFATLHAAVTASGIADMGTPLPMLAPLEPGEAAELDMIVAELVAAEASLAA